MLTRTPLARFAAVGFAAVVTLSACASAEQESTGETEDTLNTATGDACAHDKDCASPLVCRPLTPGWNVGKYKCLPKAPGDFGPLGALGCDVAKDCAAGFVCEDALPLFAGTCRAPRCEKDADCGNGLVCRPAGPDDGGDPKTLRCRPKGESGQECTKASDCVPIGPTTTCAKGTCRTPCISNAECINDRVCRFNGNYPYPLPERSCEPKGQGGDLDFCDLADGNRDCVAGETCEPTPDPALRARGFGTCFPS